MRFFSVVLVLATLAPAQEKERRIVSPAGLHYLVVKAAEERLAFELGKGDAAVMRGTLPQAPHDVFVLDGEPAAILFEKFGRFGEGFALARLDRDGKLRWKRTLPELFAGIPHKDAFAPWWRTWWVDEDRGVIVIIALSNGIVEVAMKSGAVNAVDAAAVLESLRLGPTFRKALDATVALMPKGARQVVENIKYVKLAARDRLRIALIIQKAGGDAVPAELWAAALAERGRSEKNAVAVLAARYMEEEAALEFLEEAAASTDEPTGMAGVIGLGVMGAPAARTLVGLLSHEDATAEVRRYAAARCAELPGDAVLPGILREMRYAYRDPALARVLVETAVATGAEGLGEKLQQHERVLLLALEPDTAAVAWLVDYFATRPTSQALGRLRAVLRAHRGKPLQPAVIRALKACSGRDYGDDVDAWLTKTLR